MQHKPEETFVFAIQQGDFALAHEVMLEGGLDNAGVLDLIRSPAILVHILEDCHNVAFLQAVLAHWDRPSLQMHFPGDGFTPLTVACSVGNVTAVPLLLQGGADPNQRNADQDATPLLCACSSDLASVEVVQHLLGAGSHINACGLHDTTALHMATLSGHTDIVQLLLQSGANPNVKESRRGKTPLLLAVHDCGNFDIALLLLQASADANALNSRGWTCLMELYYCPFRYSEPVKFARLLLEHGADPNFFPKDSELGRSPIFFSIVNREPSQTQLDLIKLLLEHGVDPDSEICNGISSLFAACVKNNFALAELLLSHGANVNWRTYPNSLTPLMAAVQHDKLELARLLLEKGANPNLGHDATGKTVLEMAIDDGNVVLIRLLLEFGTNLRDGLAIWETTKPGDVKATLLIHSSPLKATHHLLASPFN